MHDQNVHWLTTNHHQLRLSPTSAKLVAAVGSTCCLLLAGRLHRQIWIRYRVDLPLVAQPTSSPATLTPVSADFIAYLAAHPWRKTQPQIATALRFWEHGLRGGYVWIKDGQPLCMQWLLSHHDNHLLGSLPDWSGMYPPLPPECGQVENLLTLPAGMRHPGGAATAFMLAMFRLAAARGMRQLFTHIHESNRAAHAWARRTGWTAYGRIHRYSFDLPGLRRRPLYLHDAYAAPKAAGLLATPPTSS